MKKLFLLLMMILLVALCAGPAMAQVQDQKRNHGCNVDVGVDVFKKAKFYESTSIDKDLCLKVKACVKANEWAQASVAKCDVNTHNDIKEASTSKTDAIYDPNIVGGQHVSYGADPFNPFTGIAQVNQGAGSANNQGNVVDVAVTDPQSCGNKNHPDPGALSHAEVAIGQENAKNELQSSLSTCKDQISDSFQNLTGIAQVNQSSGSMNNQNNVTTISANLNAQGSVALTDSFLTMSNTCNKADIQGGSYLATIDFGSFGPATGVVQVNQSPGSMNNQANSIAISYAGFK
jgi:hypothetical protein